MKNILIFLLGIVLSVSFFLPFANAVNWSDNSCDALNQYYSNAYISTGSAPTLLNLGDVTKLYVVRASDGATFYECKYTANQDGMWVRLIYEPWGTYDRWVIQTSHDYVPPPSEPAYCSDGYQTIDSDETGTDCGGSCLSECVTSCPVGTEITIISGGESACVSYSEPDAFHNCVDGYNYNAEYNDCTKFDSYPLESSQAFIDENPLPSVDVVGYSSGSFSVVSSVAPASVDDNGDGTSTTTTVTTVTGSDGSSSVTTDITTSDNTSGVVLSASSSTDSVNSVEDTPENYDLNAGDFGGEPVFDSEIDVSDMPENVDSSSMFDSFISSSPLFAVVDSFQIGVDSTVCNMSLGAVNFMGQTGLDLNIDFCRWEDFLKTLGSFLLLITQAGAVLIVVRGWK